MSVEFLIADKSEIPELVRMRIAYVLEDFENVSEEQIAEMKKRLPDYFERKLGSELIAFVAKDGSRIVGTALLHIAEIPANPRVMSGLCGEVLNVLTEKEYRGQGICSKLMGMLVEYGKSHDLARIDLSATDDGYPVYKKVGFVEKAPDYHEMRLVLK